MSGVRQVERRKPFEHPVEAGVTIHVCRSPDRAALSALSSVDSGSRSLLVELPVEVHHEKDSFEGVLREFDKLLGECKPRRVVKGTRVGCTMSRCVVKITTC